LPVPTSQLLETVASALKLEAGIVFRHWRALREADLVPAGTSGRGGREAMVDSDSAATLLVALLASESARAAPTAVAKMRSLVGSRLFAAYSFSTSGTERYVGEVTAAPAGQIFEHAITNVIDLRRSPSSNIGGNFGNVSVWSARSDFWGSIDITSKAHNKVFDRFPGEHSYPPKAMFVRERRVELRSHKDIPAWASPGPFVRSAYFTSLAIYLVAECLGPLTEEEWSSRDYPRFERTITYSRPASEDEK
jgi:hypothetical protein